MVEVVATVAVTIAANWLISKLQPKPSTETNYRLPASSYGKNIPEILNYWRIAANWVEPAIEDLAFRIQERSNKADEVYGTFLGLLADGGESGCEVRQIFLNGDRIVNFDSTDAETISASAKEFLFSFEQFDRTIAEFDALKAGTTGKFEFISGLPTQGAWTRLDDFYGVNSAFAYRGNVLLGFNDVRLTEYGNTFPTCSVVLKSLTTYTVGQAVRRICEKAGIDTNLVDTTELDAIGLRGLAIPQNGEEYLKSLEQLMSAFFFYPVETQNGGIAFRGLDRPGLCVAIPESDFNPHELGSNSNVFIDQEFEDTTELPTQIDFGFYNAEIDYEQDSISSDPLPGVENTNITKISADLVLSRSEAKIVANRYLYQLRNSYLKYKFSVPLKYWGFTNAENGEVFEPGAVVLLPTGDLVQISNLELGGNYLLEVEANFYDSVTASYTTPQITSSNIRTETVIKDSGFNQAELDEFYLLDIPLFETVNTEDTLFFFSNNPGDLYVSNDGNNFVLADSLNNQSTIGTCVTTLGSIANDNLLTSDFPLDDATNTLDITINRDIDSITPGELELGYNLFFVGTDASGSWQGEFIQVQTCTLTNPGEYTLSNIRRGLYGSQWYIDKHVANEKIFMLRGDTVNFANYQVISLIAQGYVFGDTITYKQLVNDNQDISLLTTRTFNYQGHAYRPHPSLDANFSINQDDDLIITWNPQSRIGNSGESPPDYTLEILDGAAIVRTVTGLSSPYYQYLAALQVTDFGAVQTQLSANIYQESSLVGQGYISEVRNLSPGTVTIIPTITKITPINSQFGETVRITGQNLSSIAYLAKGGYTLRNLTIISDTEITVDTAYSLAHVGEHDVLTFLPDITGGYPGDPRDNNDNYLLTDIDPNPSQIDITGCPWHVSSFRPALEQKRKLIATNYMPTNEDIGAIIYCDTSTSGLTITLDETILEAFETYSVSFVNMGTNAVTFTGNGTNTLNSSFGLVLATQYSGALWKNHNNSTDWYGES